MNELRFETCSADDSCLMFMICVISPDVRTIPLVYFETPDLIPSTCIERYEPNCSPSLVFTTNGYSLTRIVCRTSSSVLSKCLYLGPISWYSDWSESLSRWTTWWDDPDANFDINIMSWSYEVMFDVITWCWCHVWGHDNMFMML